MAILLLIALGEEDTLLHSWTVQTRFYDLCYEPWRTASFLLFYSILTEGSSDLEVHEESYHLKAKTFATVERQFRLHKPLQMILPALTVPLHMTGH